jgi:cobalt-zinc-cadmium resistance protein CzcA
MVYLPILTLQGIEGKMFKPMAETVVLALGGALLLTLTVVPALCAIFLKGNVSETENFLIRKAKGVYAPLLHSAITHRKVTVGLAFLSVVAGLALFPFLGSEFVPRLDEGSIAIGAFRLPSSSLSESVRMSSAIEKSLLTFPEVDTVVSKTGRPEIATDPMGVEMSDIFVMLKPRSQWTTAKTKEELIEKMKDKLKDYPGMVFSFSQPIELRVSELIAGVRSDVAVKIFGDDMSVLRDKAEQVAGVLRSVPGAAETKVEQVTGLPVLQIHIKRDVIARYGLNIADVQEVVETAIGGKAASQVIEGEKRFDLTVRFVESARNDFEEIRNILVLTPSGLRVPLATLADIYVEEGPAQISREHSQRRIVVETNVRGRDLGSFVGEAEQAVQKSVQLPAGYFFEWGGQFENLQRARNRLMIVVPLALFLIFVLLFTAFNSLRQAALVFTGVPLATTGGVFALFLRGMHFSISAGVGFIALFGVAVLNGVVMVSYINKLREEGSSVDEAIVNGAMLRLRPVLMTALVASLGFVPMALATGTGAEVQKPLATVVIGGLITSTMLTLLVLPTIYGWFEEKRPEVEI